jgi:N-formylmaleamate deformylase
MSPRLLLVMVMMSCAHTPPPRVASPFVVRTTGTGRAVILLPDLGMPPEAWETTVAHLSPKYQVHVLEVAGFSGAPEVPGPLMPQLREALVRYLTDHHLEGAVLVGMLFGATVAYWVAATEPTLVGGVVAVDTPVSRFDGTIAPEAEVGREVVRRATPDAFAGMIRRRYGQLLNDQALAATLAEQAGRSSQRVVAEAFYDSLTRDLRPGITRIRAPVLSLLTTENVPPAERAEQQAAFRAELAPIPRHEVVVVLLGVAPTISRWWYLKRHDLFEPSAPSRPVGAGAGVGARRRVGGPLRCRGGVLAEL